jgi:hypothetical protein
VSSGRLALVATTGCPGFGRGIIFFFIEFAGISASPTSRVRRDNPGGHTDEAL